MDSFSYLPAHWKGTEPNKPIRETPKLKLKLSPANY